MNKFYCDRCGEEIGEEKDVFRFTVSWFCVGSWSSYKRDLCKNCAGKAKHRLYPADCKNYKSEIMLPYVGWDHGICRHCGFDWSTVAPIANVPPYCPNCGEDMSKEDRADA